MQLCSAVVSWQLLPMIQPSLPRRRLVSSRRALAGAGEKFLAENAKKPGVKVLPSGLQYKVIKDGQGEVPKATDEVEVIYEGRLIDGTVFDATSKHGGAKTDKFRAGNLIKGWTEALTTMPVGSKWQLYIP